MIDVDLDNKPFPNEATFRFVSRLSVLLTGMKQAVLLKSLHSCNQEALKDTQAETAVRDLGHGVQIECQALTRDGGASNFTISTDLGKGRN